MVILEKRPIRTKLEGPKDLFLFCDIIFSKTVLCYGLTTEQFSSYLLLVMSNNGITLVWQTVKVVIAQEAWKYSTI